MSNLDSIIRHNVIPLSSVQPCSAEYIIPGILQLGAINILQGEPGCGKTSVMLAIAASIAGGRPIPGMPTLVQGPILILSDEDNPGQIRVAMETNGATLDMCHIVTQSHGLTIQSPALENIIANLRPVLVIIDPYQAYVGQISINQADQLRPALVRLSDVARKYNCAVAIITHTAKSRADKSRMYQSLGSIDLPAAARCIAACTTNQSGDYLLTPVKNSCGQLGPDMPYSIGPDRCVQWGPVLGEVQDPLTRDPLYHTVLALAADNTSDKLYTYDDLEIAAHSITGRTLGGWELVCLKIAGAVGARLADHGINVSATTCSADKRVTITRCANKEHPYV